MWVLIALVGAVFSVFNLHQAREEKKRLKALGIANGRSLLARTNLVAESTRLAKQTIFVLIGILAMFLPEAPDSLDLPTAQAVTGFVVRWGLIVASLLTTYQSYLSWKVRRQLTGR
jgi:hypothetical protein